jgi:hypothetical protein
MGRPHINNNAARKQEVEENFDSTFNSRKLHLVPSVTLSKTKEDQRVQALVEQVRQLTKELALMSSLLSQKDQLLQNFRVREQELKASFFHPKLESDYKSLMV